MSEERKPHPILIVIPGNEFRRNAGSAMLQARKSYGENCDYGRCRIVR